VTDDLGTRDNFIERTLRPSLVEALIPARQPVYKEAKDLLTDTVQASEKQFVFAAGEDGLQMAIDNTPIAGTDAQFKDLSKLIQVTTLQRSQSEVGGMAIVLVAISPDGRRNAPTLDGSTGYDNPVYSISVATVLAPCLLIVDRFIKDWISDVGTFGGEEYGDRDEEELFFMRYTMEAQEPGLFFAES